MASQRQYLLSAIALIGYATARVGLSPAAAADPVGPPGCGVVANPDTGAPNFGYVVVAQGDVTCPMAMTLIDRYFHDSTLEHNGNSWSASLGDGWSCRLPNAMAREYGWRTQFSRGTADEVRNGTADEVQIRFLPDDTAPAPGG
jgi:hypothetical protein